MEKKILFELSSLYRDSLKVKGFVFGDPDGEKSACIVGAMRGNEVQQIYACSHLVNRLTYLEESKKIKPGKSIMVIPCVNTYSVNIEKRFWPTDNTDINRMFPGYDQGETTQRIAAGVFESVKDYKRGVQFASFYMPGKFIPHVRIMKTGFENVQMASEFGLPYIILREPKPYDTTTLNYNWQIWETDTFSVYTSETDRIDKASANMAVSAVLNFLEKEDIVNFDGHDGYISKVIDEDKIIPYLANESGIFDSKVSVNQRVQKGEVLADILDPYEATIKEHIVCERDGVVFYMNEKPLTYNNTVLFKLIS